MEVRERRWVVWRRCWRLGGRNSCRRRSGGGGGGDWLAGSGGGGAGAGAGASAGEGSDGFLSGPPGEQQWHKAYEVEQGNGKSSYSQL